MSSDRNDGDTLDVLVDSLVDWDMSSDRNGIANDFFSHASLVDWDMSSDRNLPDCYAIRRVV